MKGFLITPPPFLHGSQCLAWCPLASRGVEKPSPYLSAQSGAGWKASNYVTKGRLPQASFCPLASTLPLLFLILTSVFLEI